MGFGFIRCFGSGLWCLFWCVDRGVGMFIFCCGLVGGLVVVDFLFVCVL